MPRIAILVASATLLSAAHADQSAVATHISATDIAAVLKQMPPQSVSDQQIRMVKAGDYNVGVGVVNRPQAATQTGIEHDKLTEVYYVLEGEGTLVTSGTLVNAKAVPSTSAIYRDLTGPSATGSAINGGESRRIAAGDVVIIPPGVPHWFNDVKGSIRYLVVRIDPERLLTTK